MRLVKDCQTAWQALGQVHEGQQKEAEENLIFRRSLYIVSDIKEGELFTKLNIRSIRPGYGLLPKYIDQIMGCRAKCDLVRGSALTWEAVQIDGNI
jgi:N-acetylneuraminate synthase